MDRIYIELKNNIVTFYKNKAKQKQFVIDPDKILCHSYERRDKKYDKRDMRFFILLEGGVEQFATLLSFTNYMWPTRNWYPVKYKGIRDETLRVSYRWIVSSWPDGSFYQSDNPEKDILTIELKCMPSKIKFSYEYIDYVDYFPDKKLQKKLQARYLIEEFDNERQLLDCMI